MLLDRASFAVSAQPAILAQSWRMHQTLDHGVSKTCIAEITVTWKHIVKAGQINLVR